MRSIKKIVEKKVTEFLHSYSVKPGSSILIAFSGGPDSTALMHILNSLPEYSQNIICAYFNHNLRAPEELNAEMQHIKKLLESRDVRYENGSVPPGMITEYAEKYKTGIEDAAREFRYRFLEECAEEYNADYIATGHNLDDVAETVLMRVFQGAGLQGLSGIPPVRGRIIRPLIGLSKREILEYLSIEGLDFSIDRTNEKTDFLRNKIRHEIFPDIINAFPGIYTSIKSITGQAAEYNDFFDNVVNENIIWDEPEEGVFRSSKSDFFKQHSLIRIKSLMKLISSQKITNEKRIRYSSIESAVSVKEPASNSILLKTNDYQIYTSRNHIFVQRLVNQHKKSYLLYLNKDIVKVADSVLLELSETPPADCGYIKICSRTVDRPMLVRSCRDGDRIRIREGFKDISKLFSEWGVLAADRALIPVLENRQGVAAVIGEHLGYNNKLAEYGCTDGHDTDEIYLTVSKLTETTGE